jgi:hypothetical protein
VIGAEHVEYLALAKDESVKKAVQSCINEPFIPFVPDALKKYIAND